MDNWKISTIVLQLELIKLNDKGQICEKLIIPDQPGQKAVGLLESEIPDDLKELIFNKLKIKEK